MLKFIPLLGSRKSFVPLYHLNNLHAQDASFLFETALKSVPDHVPAFALTMQGTHSSFVQSQIIRNAILAFRTNKRIPVYTFIEDIGLGGYMNVFTSGTYMIASCSSLLGKCTVQFRNYQTSRIQKRLGVQIKETRSQKNILSEQVLKQTADLWQDQILTNLTKARGQKLKSDIGFLRQQTITGQKAFSLGLIDEMGQAIAKMTEKFPKSQLKGLKSQKVTLQQRMVNLLDY